MTPGTGTPVDLVPSWALVGSEGLWGVECLTPGCLWTATRPTPETADAAALDHAESCHPEGSFYL